MTTVINRMQNFGVVEYLEWIRQVLGQSVYNQIMQLSPNILNFEKVIIPKEQYLYGIKRLGVRKPPVQLAAAPHTAVGYQTPNEPQAPGACCCKCISLALLPQKLKPSQCMLRGLCSPDGNRTHI